MPRATRAALTILGATVTALLVGLTTVPATTAAEITGPAPQLILDDAPFTRNLTVDMILIQAAGDTGIVVERRVTNDAVINGGVLVTGTPVESGSPWTLAAGPDGPRTVWAQLKYADGTWSAIASIDIELDRDPSTSVYFDIDDPTIFHDYSAGGSEPDWHERSSTPSTFIRGRGLIDEGETFGFAVDDGEWSFTFERHDGAIVPGEYEVDHAPGTCETTCATVAEGLTGCSGTGTVDIDAVAFSDEGDLHTLDADFRLSCTPYGIMSGSIRYGSSASIVALDQSRDHVDPGVIDVGETVDQVVTITNIGTGTTQFGEATITGDHPDDYEIIDDDCSESSLAVDQTCDLTVQFAPVSFGSRHSLLEIPDATARGSRLVQLIGFGAQPTTVDIDVDPPVSGPGPAQVTVIVTPGTANESLVLVSRDGGGGGYDRTVETLTNPSRLRIRTTMTLTPGEHTIGASFVGGNLHHPSSDSLVVAVADTGEPWGWMLIGGGTYATSRNVALSALLDEPGIAIDKLAISNDGVTWTERVASELHAAPWTLSAGNGTKTVHLRWHEGPTDQWSPVVTDSIILDASVPTVTAPRHGLAATPLSNGLVRVWVPWSGTDAGTGIARYELQQSTNGGSWTTVSASITSPALNLWLASETTYRHRVRAFDKAGNASDWATGSTFRVRRYSEHNPAIAYTGTWTTQTSTSYWLGAARRTTQAGARATLSFTGRGVGWVATKGPGRGRAEVWVDGSKVATVDLEAPSNLFRQMVWTRSWTSAGPHTIQIRGLGTAGRPAVDVDGIVVLE